MPRVPQPAPARIGASADAVRAAAIARLGAAEEADGTLVVPTEGMPSSTLATVLTVQPQPDGGAVVTARRRGWLEIPFFGWFFAPLIRIASNRASAHAIATLRHDLEGGPEPKPPAGVVGLPTVPFTKEQATLLAAASAAVAVTSFASALFGQLAGSIGDAYSASDATLSNALAVTRVGAVFALFATALADRRGRRRAILIGVVGSAVVCAVSAAAPSLIVFTGAQMFQRAFVNTTIIVAGIAVIEEAPDGARAYSASMLALAGGFGFSFAVVALLLDFGTNGWRLAYIAGALTILFAPSIARSLRETTRYRAIAERTEIRRGQVRELMDSRYGRRFVLLAIVGFLANVFNAPSSQLMNKYLEDVRDFSSPGIALFRTVTTAIPGLVGLIAGGRLAEKRGRKPVAITALLIATTSQMVFFLQGGTILWLMSALSVLTSAAAGVALGTLDAELFPTEVRGTSNALLLIVTVLGSGTGLLIAGHLSDPLGGIGRSIALCGIAALVAAIFFVPRLPETHTHTLDDVSPSERPGEYGPDRALD